MLGSRQLLPFRKSNGPHAWLTVGTALPLHCWKGNLCSAPSIGFYSCSSKLLATVQNRLCVPKLGCSCWGGRGCCLQCGHPWGQIPKVALGCPAHARSWWGTHESLIIHIPRGCPKTSGKQHGQRALVLPGAGSHSHGAPSLVPCASAPPGIWPKLCLPEPRGTGWLLQYLWGSIQPWLPGWWERSSFLLALRVAPA